MSISQDVMVQPRTPVPIRTLRVLFAALTASALISIVLDGLASTTFSLANYFSYFTVMSNVLTVLVLLVGGVVDPRAAHWQLVRGAVTLYMVITGIIYAVLLADIDVGVADPWTNNVVHRIMPVVLLIDWILTPPRRQISESRSLTWLLFPLLYGIYTLVRGPVVDWYPYPFLDPRVQGYLALAIGLLVLTVAFALMALAVGALGRIAGRWRYGSGSAGTT
ncbi:MULTISPECIES: Pr6Pr family membrane protein [unclassified Rhodococcus (in: high G+C Gram-positive bacteria)]|uniref:Pr6Pr family membrane protein n=1 Tax=unclassified Rhodococcus (in: high G+C Gram-positive bacteria) TaxID=192944 RepID=UPI00211B1BFA|nr:MULTISPECIES: Pr6Pr family membrane protein [unclassified Rhodococcus (in: high G+C Gram-positive bacteria)]